MHSSGTASYGLEVYFVDAWLCCCTHKRSAQLQVQLCAQDAKLRHLPGDLVPALDVHILPRNNTGERRQC